MKKLSKTLFFVCALLTASMSVAAQQSMTGVVSDEQGDPIVGVTVHIVGTTIGTITDIDGNYNISVEKGKALEFGFIGMITQQVVVADQKTINIVMKVEGIDINEVVVIGYGQKKKVTVTGSVSTINSEELLKSPSASVSNSLAGKISGLAAVQNTGQPGADEAALFIRGIATLNDASPIVIVDGVERPFSQIDAEEIESISILKDASATAVYGVRGANGVIIVTTKRGEVGDAKISVSTSYGFQQPTLLSKKADSYTFAMAHNERFINDGNPPEDVIFTDEMLDAYKNGGNLLYPDMDWYNYLFKDYTPQSKTNVTIRGGTKKVRYFVSLGYLYQDGILNDLDPRYNENFNFNRYNYRSNLDIDITKTTLLKVTLGGRTEIRNEPQTQGDGMWKIAGWAQPMAGSGIVDGKWISTASEYVGNLEMKDPLTGFYGKGFKNNTKSYLNLDIDVIQSLDFITQGLKVKLKGSHNTNYTHIKNRGSSPNRYEAIKDPMNPENIVLRKINDENRLNYSESTGKARNWYMEAGINYDRKFGNHDLGALVLYNQRVVYYPSQYSDIPNRTLGLVGRLTYNYKTKYLFDVNLGYNGSENFPEDKRFGWFPAISLGWIATEESFMDNVGFMDYLKIRGSYGLVGNDKIGANRFLYLPDSWDYATGGYNFGYGITSDQPGASELLIGNPNITWETATKANIGLDARFIKGKLSTSLDLFYEDRQDILIQRQTIPTFVAANLPVVNMGEVENKGYEVEIKWMDKIGDFAYNLGVNLSYAHNEIIYKDEVPQPYDYLYETGNPIGQNFGYITNGFFTKDVDTSDPTDPNNLDPNTGQVYPNHNGFRYPGDLIYKDLNNDGVIDDFDKKPIGYSPVVPEYNYGINAGMRWKGIDFSMTLAGVQNTSRVLPGTFLTPFGGQQRGLYQFQYDGRWTPETAETAEYPRLSVGSGGNNYKVSNLFIRDASYLRLKNVELGYTISSAGLKSVGLKNVRIYFNGFNLLTFSDFKFFDPESRPGSAGLYPMMKMYNIGVKFNF